MKRADSKMTIVHAVLFIHLQLRFNASPSEGAVAIETSTASALTSHLVALWLQSPPAGWLTDDSLLRFWKFITLPV